jgi:Tol biopolymer transport system component
MKFYFDTAVKLFFLLSTIPFLLSEKLHDKFDFRLNGNVTDSLYTAPYALGTLDNSEIDEASGLVASQVHPFLLYTHNDSGGEPDIFMMDTLGQYQGKIHLEGAKNQDWEDIAIGPGTDSGKSYVYVGDIGDNNAKRDKVQVYRFAEPSQLQEEINIQPEMITLRYPDGPRDSETLLVDPWNGDLLVLSKRDTSNTLYRASANQLEAGEAVLEKVMKLPVTMAVGGDISADGKQIVIKNYWAVYYWEREEGESLAEALRRKPLQLPYKPEPQGEAIGFSANGDRYYTLSESRFRIKPVLYQYLNLRFQPKVTE